MPATEQHPLILSVEGMSCAGCVRSVETALTDLPGVSAASVNFANQTAAVLGDMPAEALISAIKQAGYAAHVFENESLEVQERHISALFRQSLLKSIVALAAGCLLMSDMYLGWLPDTGQTLAWAVIGSGTLLIMVIAGGHFFRGAANALLHQSATMDTLIALGTGAAWSYSMIVITFPALVPPESRHQFFEAALFILGFVNLGKALENNARSRASLAIQRLFDRTPNFVRRVSADGEVLVPLEEIEQGDQLRVLPGDYLPVDGEIIEGQGSIDESMISGESESMLAGAGDAVKAGTVNLDGSLIVRAVGVGSETTLAAMMRLVTEAQNSKPPVARLVDQISSVFVPAVIVLALLVFVVWYTTGPAPSLSYAMVAGMSVLIVACPCALGLAVPMSIMIGLGRAASAGLLVRNSEVLQSAAKLSVIVFDKTGTLTRGEPEVVLNSGLEQPDLAIAAGLESHSNHPLAIAIVEYIAAQDVTPVTINDFASHAGGGVSGRIGNRSVIMGSRQYLEDAGYKVSDVHEEGSVVYLGIDQSVSGWFLLQDAIRSDAAASVQRLRSLGIDPVILTGDRSGVAERVAEKLGISEVHAGLLPDQKLAMLQSYQSGGQLVGMVGDGINDAAALAAADVGFAMGQGTDVAIESADITLLGASLDSVAQSVVLSRRILKNIRQNLFAAFAYNALLIPVAAGVLYPLTGALINPAMAGLAMALSSVSVVLNAGRLKFG